LQDIVSWASYFRCVANVFFSPITNVPGCRGSDRILMRGTIAFSTTKYVGLKEWVDVVGVEHICIGTDQQVVPSSLQDYSQWVHLIAAMLRGASRPKATEKLPAANIYAAAVG
jgi:hypothetical protein